MITSLYNFGGMLKSNNCNQIRKIRKTRFQSKSGTKWTDKQTNGHRRFHSSFNRGPIKINKKIWSNTPLLVWFGGHAVDFMLKGSVKSLFSYGPIGFYRLCSMGLCKIWWSPGPALLQRGVGQQLPDKKIKSVEKIKRKHSPARQLNSVQGTG